MAELRAALIIGRRRRYVVSRRYHVMSRSSEDAWRHKSRPSIFIEISALDYSTMISDYYIALRFSAQLRRAS